MKQKIILAIILGIFVPFFCFADFDRIYNFYGDPQNEDRITIKWTYNPEKEIEVEQTTSHWSFDSRPEEKPWYSFGTPVSLCTANSENQFCYTVPTTLYRDEGSGWEMIEENVNGLTYDDVSEYLAIDFCLNAQDARFDWLNGEWTGVLYFDDERSPWSPFCWGQEEPAQTLFWANLFFGYFFIIGEKYLFVLMALIILTVVFASLIRKFLIEY